MTILDLLRIGGLPSILAALAAVIVWLAKELQKTNAARIDDTQKYAAVIQAVHASHSTDLQMVNVAHATELAKVQESRVEEMSRITEAALALREAADQIAASTPPPPNKAIRK